MKLHTRTWMFALATYGAITYLLCIGYGLIVPSTYHAAPLLEQMLPGFKWLTAGSFFLGLFETVLYGAYAGVMIAWIHNWYFDRFVRDRQEAVKHFKSAA